MNNTVKSVITGDLVGSRRFSSKNRIVISNHLKGFVDNHSLSTDIQYDIVRGDSLQGVLKNNKFALRHAVYIRALMNSIKLKKNDRTPKVNIRLSIGVGEVTYEGASVSESDGPAFQFSGITLDTMKKSGHSMRLTTARSSTNLKWDIILSLLEEVMNDWSIASAELVSLLLWDDNEKRVSEVLGISQPAVNLRKKHASWDAIKKTIEYYEKQFARIK